MYENASQVVTEAIGSIRTVASFCAEKRVIESYSKKCQASMKQSIRSAVVGGLGFSFSYLVSYLAYALCFYVGAQFVHEGKSTFKDVFRVRDTYFTSFTCVHSVMLLNALILVIRRFTLLWFSQLLGFHKQVERHQIQQKPKNLQLPY
jgi:ABC-type bacteriocin/lantibiotic exporter with double-glycine peptidase domain